MNRTKQKREHVGFRLRVNHTGDVGAKNWKQVGFLFSTPHEAVAWADKHYSHVKKYKVEGVRISTEKVQAPERSSGEKR